VIDFAFGGRVKEIINKAKISRCLKFLPGAVGWEPGLQIKGTKCQGTTLQAAEKLLDWGVNRKKHPPGAKAPTHFIGFAARLKAAP
jgi:hypothetical protein